MTVADHIEVDVPHWVYVPESGHDCPWWRLTAASTTAVAATHTTSPEEPCHDRS